jgi:hypothetical protein
MKRILRISILFLHIFFQHQLFAQFNYTFTAVAGSYSPNAIPVNQIFGPGDESIFAGPITLGSSPSFIFKFGCVNYTEVVITENGMFTFDGTCTTFHNVNALNTQPADRPIVAPLWDDLGVGFSAGSNVNYKLTGASPNRVFTIEWKQMLWGWMAGTFGISFQAKLYETTNVIEFIYQRNGATATDLLNSPSASIGLGGTAVGQYYSLNGTGGAPAALTGSETNNLNSKPATGQIYRWTPVCALPISLVDFYGKSENGKNVLYWSTASEENNAYFTIERSTNAIDFEEMTRIPGAGNSNELLHYSKMDEQDNTSVTYYRMKQSDYDGASTYSPVISMQPEQLNSISIYPNPAGDQVTIRGIEKSVQYTIHTTSGVAVQSGEISPMKTRIDLSQISGGIYYLEIDHQFTKLVIN